MRSEEGTIANAIGGYGARFPYGLLSEGMEEALHIANERLPFKWIDPFKVDLDLEMAGTATVGIHAL